MNVQSKKPSDQSEEASARPESDSVFDFLYYDAPRIASFLSQFDPQGHLTQVTSTERAHRSQKSNVSDSASGSLAVLKGTVSSSTDTSSEYGEQNNRSYDPRWANALAFLDYLYQRGLLQKDIETSGIGEIILLSGDLAVFDLGMLRQMWGLPTIKKLLLASQQQQAPEDVPGLNRKERRNLSAAKQKGKNTPNEAEIALELLTILPHAIQASISKDDISTWCSLREEHLALSPSDLFMKHGLTVAGDWTIVGVLDAIPDDDDFQPPNGGPSLNMMNQMLAGAKLGFLGFSLAPNLVGPIRQLMGRPPTSYGITPLLIFREVAGRD